MKQTQLQARELHRSSAVTVTGRGEKRKEIDEEERPTLRAVLLTHSGGSSEREGNKVRGANGLKYSKNVYQVS